MKLFMRIQIYIFLLPRDKEIEKIGLYSRCTTRGEWRWGEKGRAGDTSSCLLVTILSVCESSPSPHLGRSMYTQREHTIYFPKFPWDLHAIGTRYALLRCKRDFKGKICCILYYSTFSRSCIIYHSHIFPVFPLSEFIRVKNNSMRVFF